MANCGSTSSEDEARHRGWLDAAIEEAAES